MFLLVVGYIRGKSSPVPARRCFSGRLRGISAGISLLYPRGGVFPAGCGYIRAFFSPVPARRYFYDRLRVYPREIFSCTRAPLAYAFRRHALAWLHAQRLLKSVSDGLSTGVCKQPRMAYVCGLNERYPGGTLSRAVFFSYYTTLFFL